jgi:hypothetical protein
MNRRPDGHGDSAKQNTMSQARGPPIAAASIRFASATSPALCGASVKGEPRSEKLVRGVVGRKAQSCAGVDALTNALTCSRNRIPARWTSLAAQEPNRPARRPHGRSQSLRL